MNAMSPEMEKMLRAETEKAVADLKKEEQQASNASTKPRPMARPATTPLPARSGRSRTVGEALGGRLRAPAQARGGEA